MNETHFRAWLDAYGRAWQQGDAKTVMTLFAPGASYHETPFDPPLVGLDAIHDYWKAGAGQTQTDVEFTYEVLDFANARGIAHWRTAFVRLPARQDVRLDGVLVAHFDRSGRCKEFREWWHRQETP